MKLTKWEKKRLGRIMQFEKSFEGKEGRLFMLEILEYHGVRAFIKAHYDVKNIVPSKTEEEKKEERRQAELLNEMEESFPPGYRNWGDAFIEGRYEDGSNELFKQEISCKIVYYGPGLAGKTTNLDYIHDYFQQHSPEKLVSLHPSARLPDFVGLCYSINEIKLFYRIFTRPGASCTANTDQHLLQGADGIVFVVDTRKNKVKENLNSWAKLKDILIREYHTTIEEMPLVIQWNKRDLKNILSLDKFDKLKKMLNVMDVPSVKSVAVSGKGVLLTLKMCCELVFHKIKKGCSPLQLDGIDIGKVLDMRSL